jgi:HlyD family secretion protein
VTEGAAVSAGDVLIRLDGSVLQSERAIIEIQLSEMMARRARLEAERDDADTVVFTPGTADAARTRPELAALAEDQTRLFDARRDTLRQKSQQIGKRLGQIASQIGGIDTQIAALRTQLVLLRREIADQQTLLDQGLAQSARVLGLQREDARMEGQIGELTASRAQAEGRRTELEIERIGLSTTRREDAIKELRDVSYQELDLSERHRAIAERIARLVIRAPVSGIVLGLTVTTPRSVIRPADPVLYLIPQDRPLVVSARIPTVHIDQIHAGQMVRLHFSAFNSRTTPDLTGHVAVVSADAIRDDRASQPYYRTEIVLDPGEAGRLGKAGLVPGMPVEAFIRTEDRSPLAYLVKPFADYFSRAFRES